MIRGRGLGAGSSGGRVSWWLSRQVEQAVNASARSLLERVQGLLQGRGDREKSAS